MLFRVIYITYIITYFTPFTIAAGWENVSFTDLKNHRSGSKSIILPFWAQKNRLSGRVSSKTTTHILYHTSKTKIKFFGNIYHI